MNYLKRHNGFVPFTYCTKIFPTECISKKRLTNFVICLCYGSGSAILQPLKFFSTPSPSRSLGRRFETGWFTFFFFFFSSSRFFSSLKFLP